MITINRRPLRAVALLLCITALFTTYFLFETEQNAQTKPAEVPRELRAEFAKADAVTETIRKASAELVRVPVAGRGDRQRIAERGTIIADYGSFVIAAEKERNGLSGEGSQRLETTLHLPGRTFEPLANRDDFAVEPGAESEGGKGYFLVQFGATASDDWLESIREVGLEVVQYVPHQAFLVYGEHSAAVKAAGHSRVRWVGRYLPEHRLDGFARSFAAGESETAIYDIAVFSRSDLRASAWEFRSKVGGRIIAESELANNFFNVLRVEMPVSQLENAAAMDHVFRIDPYVKPTTEDERAAQIVAGNYVNVTTLNPPGYDPLTQFGADGTNVTVMVSDDGISIPGNGGFYITANNTVDGPLRGGPSGATGGHGHINASIIAGYTPFGTLDGQGFNYGVGIAPRANIINIPFLVSGNTTTDAQAVDDALNTLGPNGVRGTISNNSWGSGTNNNSYDSYAATYDGLVRDASFASTIDPFTIIFSAGNSGLSGLTRPKVSKNTIAVANSENIRTELGSTGADNMDDLRSSSSRGIALDGRIKPDITAPGTVITGSRAGSCGSVSSCFDANHAYSTGTSHAAPQVAGAAALFTQYWKDRNGGAYPSPAMIKSAIVLSGQEMNGSLTAASTTPNGNEGWGRMNMRLMMNTGVPMRYVDQTHEFFNSGESVAYTGIVGDPSKPLRVALVWTDPPGVSNPALVNNLDLTVDVGGVTYRGNVFTGGHSTTGGTNSTIDNVEQVRLPAGTAAGTPVTITVAATALNGDGILGNSDVTDQHFAVVAYNVDDPTACGTSITPLSQSFQSSGGNGEFSVVATAECNWSAVANDSWITITGGSSGNGNGTVSFSVQPNTGPARVGTIVADGRNFTVNQSSGCVYSLDDNGSNFPAVGGTGGFSITSSNSSCAWTATSNVPWITITGGSTGTGDGSVSFSVQSSIVPARVGTITAAGRTFTVNQSSGCTYVVAPASTTVSASGGSGSVSVSAGTGCVWSATSQNEWIVVTGGGSGSGSGTISYSVGGNTGPARLGAVSIGGNSFTINQDSGCAFSISPSSANFPAVGGTGGFSVTSSDSSCAWTAASNVQWITVTSGGSGSGNGEIAFDVETNISNARTGTLTVGGQTYTVNQASGCVSSLSNQNQNVGAGGGNGSFSVNGIPSCNWTAVSNDDWITITGNPSGSGSGNVFFSVSPNIGPARSGTVTVGGQTFTVNQADGCTFSFSVNSTTFSPAGGVGGFNVTTVLGCSWAATTNSAWITVNSGSGNGNGAVTFTVAPNLGSARTDIISVGSQVFTINQLTSISASAPFDFDGDGKTDISIFRQGPGEWWYLRSSDGANRAFQFGSSSDAMVPADYTGDGKADLAFWRPASGEWFVLRSEDSTFFSFPFGAVGDVPTPGDFDGDGKADAAVFRAAVGTWFILRSSGGVGIEAFGTNGDQPAVADYDGDGKADVGVFRPNGASGTEWWINRSTAGLFAVQFGSPTDRTVQGDHTGDGKADIAFYRPSTGEWYVLRSEDTTFFAFPFGAGGDVAVPGDYDGDGKTDAAVFRPGSATWFVNRSTGGVGITGFGLATDVPVPSAYVR